MVIAVYLLGGFLILCCILSSLFVKWVDNEIQKDLLK